MDATEKRLADLGYTLPEPFRFPKPNRTGCVRVGNLLLISGHGRNLPALPGVRASGRVGADMTIEEGYATARATALSILSSVKMEIGSLDRVKRVARLFGMVKVAAGFDHMPEVIDGASDLMFELFGPERGRHARTAVGMYELPHGIAVEINGEMEIEA
ncbi:RidA family protein [Roseomonas sp. AR75]|uniref:RidA family protein n=1 Tax=Roseomonas sp. AR75 TaxID=2562311 RepID=UPI0010C01488|nr:RidA family protein [Roseomonas sp. AR75]